ncbi:phage tail spike protein [Peribacillus sp. SIMBA_075]|uniref:phage tail spike protein n=1 Tax=Peribacillus sp. SIMBA_075 TaxID=3085813 RepID=UPI003978082D
MSDLFIFDPHDNLVAILSNDGEETCPFWSAPFKELLNQGTTFEFTAAGNHEDSQHIVAENQVAFMDKDGFFRLFTIKELERTDGADGPVITAVCEAAMLELNDEVIEDVRPYNVTLKTAITKALEGVRWKVGVVAELGLDSTNFYYMTPTEAITECINTWGGELRDRVEIEGNRITGRFIDILPRRGEDIGKRWEIDKDILSITERVQSYPKTALYGRGSSLEVEDEEGEATGGFTRKITFADIEWKVKNGDPVDKPKGQKWVGDPEALTVFGRENADGTLRHRKGIFESSEQEDPAALLQETWEALQEQKYPIRNFEMSVFLLENIIGYEHEKVRLGDTTFALDYSFAKPIEVEERVISFEYDVSDPDNSGVVELGNFIDLYSDDARLDQIESELNDNKGVWNNGGKKPITDDRIENVTPSQPLNVIASGLFQNVLVEWDFVNTISIANYEVYASQIQGFTPDISNLAFRGKTSIYTHQAGTNQQWYFRVRAVNTHGVSGPFSEEAMAQTARIISDDILFGPEIAEELRELSKEAQLLADGTVDFNMVADDVKTPIQNAVEQANHAVANANLANQNAQEAITEAQGAFDQAQSALLSAQESFEKADVLSKVVDVNTGSISLLAQTAQGLQTQVADNKNNITTVTQTATALLSRISNAEGDIGALQLTATSLATRLTNTEGSISTLTQTAQGLQTQVSDKVDQSTVTQLAGVVETKISTVDADGKFATQSQLTQTATSLTSTITQVQNHLDHVEMTTTSQISQLADNINLRVKENDVVNQINISTEGILINGKKVHITGQTIIDNAVIGEANIKDLAVTSAKIANLAVGTAAIANAAITNAKIANLSVGTAQMQDASITNAKIGNLAVDDAKIASISADKINAGAIRGIDIYGSQFRSSDGLTQLDITGGNVRLRQNNGQYVHINPDGLFGYNAGGDVRFRADSLLVTSRAVGTTTANVYLAAQSGKEARVVDIRDVPSDGEIGSYRYLPIRSQGFYGNYVEVNAGETGINLYLRPRNGGEVRITGANTIDSYYPLRAGHVYSSSFITTTTSAWIGTDSYLHVVAKGTAEGNLNPIYRNLMAYDIYGRAFITTTSNAYIGSDDEVRIVNKGLTDIYRNVRAHTYYGNAVDINTGTHIYVRPTSGGKLRVTATGTTGIFRPVEAGGFENSSLESLKQDIDEWKESALGIIKNHSIYQYHLKSDIQNSIIKEKYGFVIGESYDTPVEVLSASGQAIDQYAMASVEWKAIQEVSTVLDIHDDDINWLKIENQYLKQKIAILESKIA